MKTARPHFVTATLLGMSLAPLTTHAASEQEAIQACSNAMIKRVETSFGVTVLDVEVKGEDANSSRRLRKPAVYLLSAANAQTDAVVATARCFVSTDARVRNIKVWPLDTQDS